MHIMAGPFKIVGLFFVNDDGSLLIHTKYDRYSRFPG